MTAIIACMDPQGSDGWLEARRISTDQVVRDRFWPKVQMGPGCFGLTRREYRAIYGQSHRVALEVLA